MNSLQILTKDIQDQILNRYTLLVCFNKETGKYKSEFITVDFDRKLLKIAFCHTKKLTEEELNYYTNLFNVSDKILDEDRGDVFAISLDYDYDNFFECHFNNLESGKFSLDQ